MTSKPVHRIAEQPTPDTLGNSMHMFRNHGGTAGNAAAPLSFRPQHFG
eukprot:CAMPEP_0204108786 /NCGR_PEP_ID=MMETSP0361-20130328/913_1 /ASSEMBLY_ACC=CAM_ASM_000343 /TAXON_ID=268821 /ORGANISM="Scrippsiella Hangoei, Strain SHTV-5" /LENGTH=47 /DNA_ID= /DNA_START= /DNA_END= /DNA_ORIENTATION=